MDVASTRYIDVACLDASLLSAVFFTAYTSISTADPENGAFGNPIVESSVGAAQVVGSPMRPKVDAALVRVTSLDSGGSGNGSNGVVIGELSGAHSSINMWHVRFDLIVNPTSLSQY
jgi:hypothetical protein